MPLRPTLLSDIQSVLGSALPTALTTSSAAGDLYEAYLFALVCQAAKGEGGTVNFRSRGLSNPSIFIFRTSPGCISSTNSDYGYARISFQNKPALEEHVGVRIAGASQVLHECDVCVLFQDEADLCRNSAGNLAPRAAKVIISVEAKFYDNSLGLGLGRGFLGFTLDVRVDKAFFVVNRTSGSIEKLLSHRKRLWEHNIQPQNLVDVNRLKFAFQTAFKDFNAKY
jgi:hypothetical protein